MCACTTRIISAFYLMEIGFYLNEIESYLKEIQKRPFLSEFNKFSEITQAKISEIASNLGVPQIRKCLIIIDNTFFENLTPYTLH